MSTRVDPVFHCVLWEGRKDRDGYGIDGRKRVHIEAWRAEFGDVPEGFELDHTCRRRACSFVPHLEAVTRGENEKRKLWRYRVRIKSCPKGHVMTDALVTPEGGRLCRTCMRDWQSRGHR